MSTIYKKTLSVLLALALLLGMTPVTASAEIPYTYNPAHIAVINDIIKNNGLNWTLAPVDGSSVPENWTGVMWTSDPFDEYVLRIQYLNLGNCNLTGTLNINGLASLEYLYCDKNQLTKLIMPSPLPAR